MRLIKYVLPVIAVFAFAACASDARPTPLFASAAEIDTDGRTSWENFVQTNDAARALNADAEAVLIFPNIVKAGFIAGGAYGDGVLIKGDETVGYYNSVSASWGFQAGAQRFGYALVFTNESALDYINNSEGWEIGVGPSVVIADKGLGRNLTSTTLRADVYAFIYGQQGLMGGGGIQGTKITQRVRDN
jgi:lipid-binding SYLF domain-containing protein